VQRVSTHSHRGLHSTLATEAGATAHFVAHALGHASPRVTEMHYIDRGATLRARSRRVIEKLQDAPANEAQPDGIATAVGNG
jgi:integrase